MADRFSEAVLELRTDDSEYNRGLQDAEKRADTFSGRLRDAGKNLEEFGFRATRVGRDLTVGLTAPIAAVGIGVVKSFADFDRAMNSSLAIMGDVSGAMRQDMTAAAQEVATTTKFSAREAAEAYFFLASAGLDAKQSIAALPQVAEFAQAGNFDLARATDLLTDSQSALGLASDDAQQNLRNQTRVSDVLVKANTIANASVEQFATSLTTKAATSMRQLNIDVESGVAVLAAWADQGVKAEQAGERFNIVTRDLQTAALNNKAAFEQQNIAVFDSQGNFRNLADIVEDMEGALGGMSAEQQKATLMQLGFTDRSVQATQSLLGLSGQIRQYESDLRGAAGTTSEVSNKQLQTFWAQLGLIKDQLIGVAITLGAELVPILQGAQPAVQRVTEAVAAGVRLFGQLPQPIKTGAVALGALTAATGPALIGIGQVGQGVGQLSMGLGKAGDVIARNNGLMGLFTTGLGRVKGAVIGTAKFLLSPAGLVAAVLALGAAWALAEREARKAEKAYDQQTKDLNKLAMASFDAWSTYKQQGIDGLRAVLEEMDRAKLGSKDFSRSLAAARQMGFLTEKQFTAIADVVAEYRQEVGVATGAQEEQLTVQDLLNQSGGALVQTEEKVAEATQHQSFALDQLNSAMVAALAKLEAQKAALMANASLARDGAAAWSTWSAAQLEAERAAFVPEFLVGPPPDGPPPPPAGFFDKFISGATDLFQGDFGPAVSSTLGDILSGDDIAGAIENGLSIALSVGMNAIIPGLGVLAGPLVSAISGLFGSIFGGLFGGKTNAAKVIAKQFGLTLSDQLTAEIQRIGDAHGRDYGAAFRLALDRVIPEVGVRTVERLRFFLGETLNLFADFDRGTIGASEAVAAIGRSLGQLLPKFATLNQDLSVLTNPGGILSSMVDRMKRGHLESEDVLRIFQQVAAAADELGLKGTNALIALAREAGFTAEQIGAIGDEVEASGDKMSTTWRDALQTIGVNSTFFFGQTKKEAEEAVKALGLSAELEAKLITGLQQEANQTFRQQMRERLRALGFTEEEIQETIKASIQQQRKEERQADRERRKELREREVEQISSGKLVKDRMIQFADLIEGRWTGMYEELGAGARQFAGMFSNLDFGTPSLSFNLPSFATGTGLDFHNFDRKGELAVLHGPEAVVRPGDVPDLAEGVARALAIRRSSSDREDDRDGGGDFTITIPVQLDGREIDRRTVRVTREALSERRIPVPSDAIVQR